MHCHHGGLPPRFLPDEKSGMRPDFELDGVGLRWLDVRNSKQEAPVAGDGGLLISIL